MELVFNPKNTTQSFYHERSESKITVAHVNDNVLITFSDEDGTTATLELTSNDDVLSLKESLVDLKGVAYGKARGFSHNRVVLSIRYDNYGDPYEEAILFMLTVADSDKQWQNEDFSASLNLNELDFFIEAITQE